MDPAGQGALLGIGFLIVIFVSCMIRERCEKRKPVTEHTHLLETKPTLIGSLFTKKHVSMRDFFDKNTKTSELKVISIS